MKKKRLVAARLLEEVSLCEEEIVFLLDDPFADLDNEGRKLLTDNIIKKEAFTVIMATNSRRDIKYLQKSGIDFRLFELKGGRVC